MLGPIHSSHIPTSLSPPPPPPPPHTQFAMIIPSDLQLLSSAWNAVLVLAAVYIVYKLAQSYAANLASVNILLNRAQRLLDRYVRIQT